MYCPKCSAENVDGVQSCQSCGAILDWGNSPAPIEQPRTYGLAIASLVCGLLSMFTCFITGIPAVIMGIISLVKINNSQGRLKGMAMAVTGIVVPVIIIPVAALLLAIMMPALGQVKQQAMRTVCATNMKGFSYAMSTYSMDYDGAYPTGSKWCDLLIAEADVSQQSFVCLGSNQGQSNYALNSNAVTLGKDAPNDMVLMFECSPGWNQAGGAELLTTENHAGEGCNIMHVDGSIRFVKTEDLDKLRWTVDEN